MKILIHGRAFPVAMWRWFDWALRDLGHEVFSVGCHYGGKIPWGDNFDYPQYNFPPDHIIPEATLPGVNILADVKDLYGFEPDVVIQAADTIGMTGELPVKNVVIETDPHAVDYTERIKYADIVFSMQDFYRKEGQFWLPYGWYPPIHRYLEPQPVVEYDVVFSGLQYDQRKLALEAMRKAGLQVYSNLGDIYEEYVTVYNKGIIAFNWSSKQDLPARFWEGMAMGRLVLTNHVPDMDKLDHLKPDTHYVTFSSVAEAVEKAKYYSKNIGIAQAIGLRAREAIIHDTYLDRAEKMLEIINEKT